MSDSVDIPSITPTDNGPYRVEGPVQLIDVEGKVIRSGGTFALCRCGGSKNKPFCDRTHRVNGFESVVRAD
jgi:CDGSH-type Zn-finger protein